MIGSFWSRRRAGVDNAGSPRRSTSGGPRVKKTLARLAAVRHRAVGVMAAARVGIYNVSGLACGVAALWVEWGVGAGLGGACVSLLLMGVLSDDQEGAAR
mgnify:CR=1 FL=1